MAETSVRDSAGGITVDSIDRADLSGIGDRTYWFCSWHGLENFCVDGR